MSSLCDTAAYSGWADNLDLFKDSVKGSKRGHSDHVYQWSNASTTGTHFLEGPWDGGLAGPGTCQPPPCEEQSGQSLGVQGRDTGLTPTSYQLTVASCVTLDRSLLSSFCFFLSKWGFMAHVLWSCDNSNTVSETACGAWWVSNQSIVPFVVIFIVPCWPPESRSPLTEMWWTSWRNPPAGAQATGEC